MSGKDYDGFRDFLDEMEEDGYSLEDALDEWDRIQNEKSRRFIEAYEDDPTVQYGWYQQDMIDLRYIER